MRTKTLAVGAAILAAGLASSMAQTVYSVNTVGYVNLTIPPNYSIIANPLIGATNTIPALFAGVPTGTIIYKFVNQAYQINQLRPGALGWSDKTMTLVPGEGVFIFNPTTTNLVNTFVGEVASGNLTNAIPAGFSIVSSMVPQTGKITTDLGYVTGTGSQSVYLYDSVNGYTIKSTLPNGNWIGGEPTITVGQGFFISVPTARNWTRTFTTGT